MQNQNWIIENLQWTDIGNEYRHGTLYNRKLKLDNGKASLDDG